MDRDPASRPRAGGFTLVELMITVAIVAILAAVAYPSYTHAVQKGRRAEGRTGLTALMQQQERYFTQNGRYLLFNGPTDAAGNTAGLKAYSSDGAKSAYTLGAAKCPGGTTDATSCVLVFAVPAVDDADCGTLTITSIGLVRGFGASLSVSGSAGSTAVSGAISTAASGCWR